MKSTIIAVATAVLALGGLGSATDAAAQDGGKVNVKKMSFFITSAGLGQGADLGGLEGADAHCAKLAKAAGSQRTNWRAYLSTSMVIDRSGGRPFKITPGVNARERIGKGPWFNSRGVRIAKNVRDLHGSGNKMTLKTALNEKGSPVNGRTEKPNQHDILTGSDPEGRYSTAGGDTTCGNWTKSGGGSAIVGHHDRAGLNDSWNMLSWNSSHGTAGCGEADLPKTGGAGLFYCFAAN